MKKIYIFVFLIIISIQTNYAQEILNLNCIENATNKIARNEIEEIINFTDENKKILILPFYSKNEIFTEISISMVMDLTTALQQEIQKTNNNLTFYYDTEYNKEGNKILQKYHLTQTENVSEYWKGIIERFNPDYYIDGYYFIEKNLEDKYFLTLKNITLKPNDLNNEIELSKYTFNNISVEITDQVEIDILNEIENKNTFIFIETNENIFGQTTRTIKSKIRTQLYETGFTIETLQENANYKIIIEATAREYNNTYEVFFSYADVYVEIINLQTQKTIYQKDFSEKGGSTISYKKAAQTAFDNVSQKITTELIEILNNN